MRNKKAFTIIELIAVLVILAILALIVTPLVMSIINKAKESANKRSVDAYGRSVELAIASHMLDTGAFPTDLSSLTVEYTGKKVVCNVMQMKENGGLYMSECTVGNKEVHDNTDDGWYHYGTRDLTNEEYVDMYGDALKEASIAYYEEHQAKVEDYTTLSVDYKGKNIACDVTVNYDGTIYLTNCKVAGVTVSDDTEDGYYHYGEIVNPPMTVNDLIARANPVTVTNYTDGNTTEMYTFEHPATTQTGALTDYRYIGANPNNYVTFNDELWRIIGVFAVEDENGNTEQRIKIIRNEKLTDEMALDSNGNSDWTTASLKNYLNGDYYNNLTSDAKSMVADTKYYLGKITIEATDYYSFERGTSVSSVVSGNWIGKIGLMYPSDYTYTYSLGVDNTCYSDGYYCKTSSGGVPTNGWIYNTNSDSSQWFISPQTRASSCRIIMGGAVDYKNSNKSFGVRPCLYLVSNIKIDSGEGTEQNPYMLKL